MLARLVLLFVVLPLVELALLMFISDWTSPWFTIGLVILTGLVGGALARRLLVSIDIPAGIAARSSGQP